MGEGVGAGGGGAGIRRESPLGIPIFKGTC